jgi:hypothetical protein
MFRGGPAKKPVVPIADGLSLTVGVFKSAKIDYSRAVAPNAKHPSTAFGNKATPNTRFIDISAFGINLIDYRSNLSDHCSLAGAARKIR